jgi:5-methylcytosine-specific restriction endonuclease McrA
VNLNCGKKNFVIEDVGTTARGNLSTRRKLAIWEREKGLCMLCGCRLQVGGFIYEHVRALELGGADSDDNIRLTCMPCAGEKTRNDHKMAAKAKRVKAKSLGMKKSKNPLPGSKGSKWKRKMDGTIVPR